ncbi:receptor-type guanylate cyclase gcy-12-like isoform X2 [Paramacrobiotus metropolitanus]|uniref:receptor-type guanylate cyclase gcy-12-like isoform X2 n=1 Tax=Paramacrobiotus metropolitanus TaxID=2943436 RepID=UPI002445A74E|nr:receptor-type guanylate cyclase gcy-12-like isoform X2 [Paramacrobiotus metropolitanus]
MLIPFQSWELHSTLLFVFIASLSWDLVHSDDALTKKEVQFTFVGSQMCIYVHKALLNTYTTARVQYVNIRGFTNYLYQGISNATYYNLSAAQNMSGITRFSLLQKGYSDVIMDEYPVPRNLTTLYPDLEAVPSFMYQVAIIYNVNATANPSLNLTREMLVGIFNRTITFWNDTRLSAACSSALPNASIIVFLIGPQTGLTTVLSTAFSKFDRNWNQTYGKFNAFDSSTLYQQQKQAALAKNASDPYRLVSNGDATLAQISNTLMAISYTGWMNATILKNSTQLYHKNQSSAIDLPQSKAYPLVGMTYIIMRKSHLRANIDCNVAAELLRYYRWFHRDPSAAAKLSSSFEIIGIPNATYDQTIVNLSTLLTCGDDTTNKTVWAAMLEAIDSEQAVDYVFYVSVGLIVPLLLCSLIGIVAYVVTKNCILMQKVNKGIYHINAREITFIEASKERYKDMLKMRPYLDNNLNTEFITGEYGFCVVLLRPFHMAFSSACLGVRKELIHMQEWKTHANLVRFLGVTEIRKDRFIVSELSLLGDLRTLLSNDTVKINTPVSFCMGRGISDGLRYLHSQGIVHGNLRSTSIYVESDWTIKISDWEYVHLYSMQSIFVSKEQVFKKLQRAPKDIQNIYLTPLLWTAPEMLKAIQEQKGLQIHPSKPADCYSFGVIFYEIMTRNMPYKYDMESGSSPMSTLLKIINTKKPLRPLDLETVESLSEIPESMLRLMHSCWHVDPCDRVTVDGINLILKRVEAETKRMADLTIVNTDFFIDKQKSDVKNYNSDLKQRVQDLRRACEDFLTPAVYESHKQRIPIQPKVTTKAYVMHMTMVEYAELLDPSHGESAIALIERFQALVNQHLATVLDRNIFRIHTSGDDCTIIAGIPTVELAHADAIASMAFDILALTWKAVMLDIDTDHIKIRIGIHCGPVLAGLYGNDHTEFTIVGEARDIAEDMERLSATYRILISEDFLHDLQNFSGYSYVLNTDENRIHDKLTTYWLLGHDSYHDQTPLDEMYAEYGVIENGKVPARSSQKKVKPPAAGAAVPLTERAQARRSSIAAHRAAKEENRERPAILERRHTLHDGRQSLRGSILDPEILKNLPSLAQPHTEEAATFDIMQLGNNQQILVVDFSQEEANQEAALGRVSAELSVIAETESAVSQMQPNRPELQHKSTDEFSKDTVTLGDKPSLPQRMAAEASQTSADGFSADGSLIENNMSVTGAPEPGTVISSENGTNPERDSRETIDVTESFSNKAFNNAILTVAPLDNDAISEGHSTMESYSNAKSPDEPGNSNIRSLSQEKHRSRKKKRTDNGLLHTHVSIDNPLPHLSGVLSPPPELVRLTPSRMSRSQPGQAPLQQTADRFQERVPFAEETPLFRLWNPDDTDDDGAGPLHANTSAEDGLSAERSRMDSVISTNVFSVDSEESNSRSLIQALTDRRVYGESSEDTGGFGLLSQEDVQVRPPWPTPSNESITRTY